MTCAAEITDNTCYFARGLVRVAMVVIMSVGGAVRGEDKATSPVERETQIAMESMVRRNDELVERLAEAQTTIAGLQQGLAIARSEAEVFQRQAGELKVRLEAIGGGTQKSGTAVLEERLLQALNDLRLSDDENRAARSALVRLYEAMLLYRRVAVSNEPNATMAVEAAMRDTAKALNVPAPEAMDATAVPATLTDAMVISWREDLNLIVANVGNQQGVRAGMPFQVIRGNSVVGVVRVVDVRAKISGAVVQEIGSGEVGIKVGDRLKIASSK